MKANAPPSDDRSRRSRSRHACPQRFRAAVRGSRMAARWHFATPARPRRPGQSPHSPRRSSAGFLVRAAPSGVSIMKLVLGSLLVLALPLAAAYADGPRHHPPQAALDACAKAKADDACSFKLKDHEIKGKCATARESSAL